MYDFVECFSQCTIVQTQELIVLISKQKVRKEIDLIPEIISGKNETMRGMNFKICWNKNHMEKLSHDTDYDGICDIYLSPPSNWFLTVTLVGIIELYRRIFFLLRKVK